MQRTSIGPIRIPDTARRLYNYIRAGKRMTYRAKQRVLSGLAVLIGCAGAACSHSQDEKPNGGAPEWNRNRTVSIYAAGSFDGRAAFTDGKTARRLATAWQGTGFRIAWLEGCDVNYEEPVKNPAVTAARLLQCIPLFARTGWTENGCRGNGVLLRHTLTRQDETEIAPDCFLKTVDTFVDAARNLPMTFGTACLLTEDQISRAKKPLTEAVARGVLVTGSIRKSLLPAWETAWQPAPAAIRPTVIDPGDGASHAFLVLSSPAWLVREQDIATEGSLCSIRLQVEWL